MTTAPADRPAPAPVHDFTTAAKRRTITFTIDGHPLTAKQPKGAWMMDRAREEATLADDDPRQMDLMETLIEKIFPATEDQGHLYGRLRDEEDDFDMDDLSAILEWLKEQWSEGRPTGSSTASAGRPAKRGGRSTARRR